MNPHFLRDTVFSRRLTIRNYTEHSSKITSPIRLILLTDLHSTVYGEDQKPLTDVISSCCPDLILMAGDIADHKVPFAGTSVLIRRIAPTWPCFYVTGNHEHWTGKTDSLKRWLRSRGVTVLDGSVSSVSIRGQLLQIAGVDDPHRFTSSHHAVYLSEGWKKELQTCCSKLDPSHYSILLSHRPELTRFYRGSGFDLVVSGHAHGGQIRIPGLCNGLLAPHQGFFPRYAGGRYDLDGTSLIVSRGLCLNRLPRIFNPPEVAVICLAPENSV